MKILYIDIGDNPDKTQKNINFLQKEGAVEVTLYNVQEIALEYKKTGNLSNVAAALDLKAQKDNEKNIPKYDQVIISAHGKRGDTEKCYTFIGEMIDSLKGESLFNAEQLASFTGALFKTLGIKSCNDLIFLVCYGARSSSYETYQTDPLGSFAYDFFYNLCTDKNLGTFKMTAAVGEIRIGNDGTLEVTPEEALKYMDKMDSFFSDLSKVRKNYQALIEKLHPSEDELFEIEQNVEDMIEPPPEENELESALYKIKKIKNDIAQLNENEPPLALKDYGQVKYSNAQNSCRISCKKETLERGYFFSQPQQEVVFYKGDLVKKGEDEAKVEKSNGFCNLM